MKLEQFAKLRVCWDVPYHITNKSHYVEMKRIIRDCGELMPYGSRRATFLFINEVERDVLDIGILIIKEKNTPKAYKTRRNIHTRMMYHSTDILEDSGINVERLKACRDNNPKKYSHDLCNDIVSELKTKVIEELRMSSLNKEGKYTYSL